MRQPAKLEQVPAMKLGLSVGEHVHSAHRGQKMKHSTKDNATESEGRIDTLTMAELLLLLANEQKERPAEQPESSAETNETVTAQHA